MRPNKIARDSNGRVILPKGVKLNHDIIKPSDLIISNANEISNDGLFRAIIQGDGIAPSQNSDLNYGEQPEPGTEATAFAINLPLQQYRANPVEVETLDSDIFRRRVQAGKKASERNTSQPDDSPATDGNGLSESED